MYPECPHCSSTLSRKNGHDSQGRQKRRCNNCYKEWIEGGRLKVRTGRPCYYCGKPMMKMGFKYGIQYYECCGQRQNDKQLDEAAFKGWYNEDDIT